MSDMTTGSADASGDAGATDYERKYAGAQIALNRKHDELTAAQRAAQEASDKAAGLEAELARYRAAEDAGREEEEAERLYESLKSRFDPEPPQPMRHNEARSSRTREEPVPTDVAWPV
jgi:hypothetical protein